MSNVIEFGKKDAKQEFPTKDLLEAMDSIMGRIRAGEVKNASLVVFNKEGDLERVAFWDSAMTLLGGIDLAAQSVRDHLLYGDGEE